VQEPSQPLSLPMILKRFCKPLTIEIIPVEKALNQRILSLKHEKEEKVNRLETYLEQIKVAIRKKMLEVKGEKGTYVLILEKENMAKLELTFENIKSEYDLVMPNGPFKWSDYLKTKFEEMGKRGVRVRILIIPNNNDDFNLVDLMKQTKPSTGDFEIKTLETEPVYFIVIDFKEVWIPITLEDKTATMVTDTREIVAILKAQFEKLWNAPQAKHII
jgi:sugar-specific transcriptional regulator TrmB